MLPQKPVDLQLQIFCAQLCKDEIIVDDFQNPAQKLQHNIAPWDDMMNEYQSLEQDIVRFPSKKRTKQQQESTWEDVISNEEDDNQQMESLECKGTHTINHPILNTNIQLSYIRINQKLFQSEEESKPQIRNSNRRLRRKLFKQFRRKMRREKQFSACEEEINSFSTNLEFEISMDPCSCAKTGCQKMYCECLARGKLCSDSCNCQGCRNREPNDLLARAVKSINSGKHDSHSTHRDRFRSQRYRDGCTCKKSQCMKKYCECFANGRQCGPGCMCEECMNIDDDNIEVKSESYNVAHTRSKSKQTEKVIGVFQKNVQVSKFQTDNQSSLGSYKSLNHSRSFKFILGGMVENTLNCRLLNQFYIDSSK